MKEQYSRRNNKISFRLRTLIVLSLILFSGLVANSVFHPEVLRVANATPPPFGLDGSVLSNASPSVSSLSVDLSTSYANDSIIVYALSANTGPNVFLNVSDSDALTWSERLNYTWTHMGAGFGTVGEFYAFSTSQLSSDTITVTQNVTDTLTINVFAISGANPYPFDDGNESSNPTYNIGAGTTPGVTLDNTSSPNDIIFGFLATSDDPGKNVGSGFTRLAGTSVAPATGLEDEIVSSLETNFDVDYSLSAGNNWTMFADAVTQLDSPTKYVSHVVMIPMENVNADTIVGNGTYSTTFGKYDSFLRNLAYDKAKIGSTSIKSGWIGNYYGVTYPSLPNYLALTSASTDGYCGGANTCTDYYPYEFNVTATPTKADLFSMMTGSGGSWVYAENEPSKCDVQDYNNTNGNSVENTWYVAHHSAFPYYLSSKSYCLGTPQFDVNATGYNQASGYYYQKAQITSGNFYNAVKNLNGMSLPKFSLVVPDRCNDMHTCKGQTDENCASTCNQGQTELMAGDNFTKAVVSLIQGSSYWSTTLVIIVWDTGNCIASYTGSGSGCSSSAIHQNGGGHVAFIYTSGETQYKLRVGGHKAPEATVVNHYFAANTIVSVLAVNPGYIPGGKTPSNLDSAIF